MPRSQPQANKHHRQPEARHAQVAIDMPDDDESASATAGDTPAVASSWRESARYLFTDILNPRDTVRPMNGKRLLVWLFGALSLAALLFILLKFSGIEALQGFLSEEILLLSVVVYGMEPLKRFLAGSLSRFPKFEAKPLRAIDLDDEQPVVRHLSVEERAALERFQRLSGLTGESVATLKRRYEKNKKLMVMIPCYKTMDKVGKARITEVITSALKHVPPENIYVVDNGPWKQPQDETEQVIKGVHPDINVQYFPYPGKTTALMKAVVDVLAHRPDLEYVLTFDNDVTVPDNYQFREQFFTGDKRVKSIVYPIRASAPDGGEKNLLTRWQDIDYVTAGANNSYLGHFGSIRKPHGAVSCWELKTLYDILRRHNGQFRGEDWQLGDLLRSQYSAEGVLKFAFDAECFFDTDAPQQYLAIDGRWPQQVRSWMVVPFLWPWKYVFKPLLTQWRTNTLGELLTMKFEQGYEGWTVFSNILRYPLMVLQATDLKFWIAISAITVTDLMLVIMTNYALLPKYLRNDLKAILTYPLHKQIDSLMQVFAFFRTLLIEVPKDSKHPSIQQLIDDGVLPSLNTDDDSHVIERAEANCQQAPQVDSGVRVRLRDDFASVLFKMERKADSDERVRDELHQLREALRALNERPKPAAEQSRRRALPERPKRVSPEVAPSVDSEPKQRRPHPAVRDLRSERVALPPQSRFPVRRLFRERGVEGTEPLYDVLWSDAPPKPPTITYRRDIPNVYANGLQATRDAGLAADDRQVTSQYATRTPRFHRLPRRAPITAHQPHGRKPVVVSNASDSSTADSDRSYRR